MVQYGLFQGEEQLKGSLWLRPKEKMVKRVPISAEARGRYIFPSITVDTGDFLGLKSASRSLMVEQEMIVRPKRIAAAATPEVLGGFLGDRSVRRFLFEDPVLTVGFHEYTGTEPMKSISWTRSAREGKLMVRRPDFTMEPSVTVVLNVAGRPDEPEEQALMERTFSLARMVLEYLDRNGVQYDFRMNGLTVGSVGSWEYVTEGHGAKHLSGILEGLGRAVLRTTFSAPELVRRAVMHTGEQRGIIFVTPGGDAETEASAAEYAHLLERIHTMEELYKKQGETIDELRDRLLKLGEEKLDRELEVAELKIANETLTKRVSVLEKELEAYKIIVDKK